MDKHLPCEAVQIEPRHWEVRDPNNPHCPLVGPYKDTSDARAKSEALAQAKRLNSFYRRNWRFWREN